MRPRLTDLRFFTDHRKGSGKLAGSFRSIELALQFPKRLSTHLQFTLELKNRSPKLLLLELH
jgi:hypothetical protein